MEELRDKKGRTEAEFLAAYDSNRYVKPAVAADVVVLTAPLPKEGRSQLEVLLIRRGNHPYLGCWALPGGFVEEEETVLSAAVRELEEETGIEEPYVEELQVYSTPGRDPRGWVMSVAHVALVEKSHVQLKAGDDAAEAAWFQISDIQVQERTRRVDRKTITTLTYEMILTNGDIRLRALMEREIRLSTYGREVKNRILECDGIAFDHCLMIGKALVRVRHQNQTAGNVFRLLPEIFTMRQLHVAYEALIGPIDYESLLAWAQPYVQDSMKGEGYYIRNMRTFMRI